MNRYIHGDAVNNHLHGLSMVLRTIYKNSLPPPTYIPPNIVRQDARFREQHHTFRKVQQPANNYWSLPLMKPKTNAQMLADVN
jgi:uncharacterized protein (DUF427 family)